jgi:hypothetical protein
MARDVGAAGRIEVGSDIGFERRWRRIQWVVWTLMILLVIAGLSGAFGRGPLSMATVSSLHNTMLVRYERIARLRTPARIDVVIRQDPGAGDLRVVISTSLMKSLRPEQTLPSPLSMQTGVDGTTMTFAHAQVPFRLRFSQEPASIGITRGTISIADDEGVAIHQWVNP